MSASRDVLERAFPPPRDAFERLAALRHRRERNRRIANGAVAILLVILLVAALLSEIGRQRHIPADKITPSNVGQLGLSWWGNLPAPGDSQPVVDHGRVYVLANNGTLSAFSTECGRGACDPIWSAGAGMGSQTDWGSVVVDGDRVYQPTRDAGLVGYPISCDANPCRPDWVGRADGDLASANPVASGGFVFVAADECCHGAKYFGQLFAFAENCSTYPTPCAPVWRAPLSGGFLGGQPVIVGDRVYVGSKDGTVSAFPINCTHVAGRCDPIWTARTHGPVTNQPPIQEGSRVVTPLVTDGASLFVQSGSWVYAFPLTCDTSPCTPSWIGRTPGGWVNDMAVSGGFVYASTWPGRGSSGGTVVFPTECPYRCKTAWTFDAIPSSPVIADGVVYLIGSGNPGDQAFSATCGVDGGRCDPLWTLSPDNGSSSNFVNVTDGGVYMAGGDGHLHVFRLGGSETCCTTVALSGTGHALWYLVFYSLLFGVIAWVVVRRRRPSLAP